MANTKNAVYVTLSTTGSGWHVWWVGEPGEARETVERKAQEDILSKGNPDHRDIETDTLLKNLTTVSKSAVVRSFPEAWRRYQEYAQYLDEEMVGQ